MISLAPSLNQLTPVFCVEPELLSSILSTASPIEVNLALDVLRDITPERTLVSAVNLREVLLSIPRFPCSMAVDELTLARVAGLQKDRLAWTKPLKPGLSISVTTAGNFCFDVIVQDGDEAVFVAPLSAETDAVNPRLVSAIMHHEELLAALVELVIDMGLEFAPQPYMSLADWGLDHAQAVMDDLSALF